MSYPRLIHDTRKQNKIQPRRIVAIRVTCLGLRYDIYMIRYLLSIEIEIIFILYYILYHNLMAPPSYMWSVVE